MPHIIVEYSENLKDSFNVKGLLNELHEALGARADANVTKDRVTSRAYAAEDYVVGDEQSPEAFMYIMLGLMKGRTPEMQKSLSEELQNVALKFIQDNGGPETRVMVNPFELSDSYCP